ncbi:hypothetical protein Anapl_15857 [Anas platyrhynchos]|uniref:Uncharacterized protein n=1 Tax=Anas platyrhynchos TaxID=8839 RepID=R0LR03_ANAPL|nr:hypothetical protein Anapl_15857 [Anas platyrhynchos]
MRKYRHQKREAEDHLPSQTILVITLHDIDNQILEAYRGRKNVFHRNTYINKIDLPFAKKKKEQCH